MLHRINICVHLLAGSSQDICFCTVLLYIRLTSFSFVFRTDSITCVISSAIFPKAAALYLEDEDEPEPEDTLLLMHCGNCDMENCICCIHVFILFYVYYTVCYIQSPSKNRLAALPSTVAPHAVT